MSVSLPALAHRYFATANTHDVERTAALFAEHAVVTDEGQRIAGRAAVREWIARVVREAAPVAAPERVSTHEEGVDVVALVSGRFPGSPVRLTFRFTLAADHITGLQIQ